MSGVPSFAFLTFGSANDRRFAGWEAFRDSIRTGRPVGDDPPVDVPTWAAPPPPLGIWRLIAANNRELARSWSVYPHEQAARNDVARLQRSVRSLVVTLIRGESASHYGWLATLHGEPVVSSGRWFGAASTSLHSAETTLADFASATATSESPASAPGADGR